MSYISRITVIILLQLPEMFFRFQEGLQIFILVRTSVIIFGNDRNVGISVYSVDLNSFKNELVYSSGGDNTEDFYGLADKESSDASEILEILLQSNGFCDRQICLLSEGKCDL